MYLEKFKIFVQALKDKYSCNWIYRRMNKNFENSKHVIKKHQPEKKKFRVTVKSGLTLRVGVKSLSLVADGNRTSSELR